MYKKLAVLFWLLLSAPHIHAASAYIQLGGWSKHFQSDQSYNESHNTAGFEVELDTHTKSTYGFVFTSFENSHWANSRHVALSAKRCYQAFSFSKGCLGITLGVIDGYKKINEGNFFPALIPKVNFEYKKVGLDFLCVPAVHSAASFCAVQGRIKLGRL